MTQNLISGIVVAMIFVVVSASAFSQAQEIKAVPIKPVTSQDALDAPDWTELQEIFNNVQIDEGIQQQNVGHSIPDAPALQLLEVFVPSPDWADTYSNPPLAPVNANFE